jgi:hypothetical protein
MSQNFSAAATFHGRIIVADELRAACSFVKGADWTCDVSSKPRSTNEKTVDEPESVGNRTTLVAAFRGGCLIFSH